MIDENLLQISSYEGEGYLPLIHYEKWRVAELRYCDELLPQNIKKLQRHDKTDEIFVLLEGTCTLFIADGSDNIGEIYAEPLKPLHVYNVKKGSWHSHTLSPDTTVLIIENNDTCDDNSPEQALTPLQQKELVELSIQAAKML